MNRLIRVQDVIDALIEPVGRLEQTVDTLKCGDPSALVTGIVTTFMPSQRVLEEAVAVGANLVIAHEGCFFSHYDSDELRIEDDPVIRFKKAFILDSGLAIFRFHDYLHRYQPDGIMEGLLDALGWHAFVRRHHPYASIVEHPAAPARQIAEQVKSALGLGYVRAAGDMEMTCRRVGLLAGYRGKGELVIPLFEHEKLDMVIYGEGPEWEVPEYVRDAVSQGCAKSLIAIGHAESEQSGMKLLADRLQARYSDIPVRCLVDKPIYELL